MGKSIWQQCLATLAEEVSAEQYETYIKPLQARVDDGEINLFAPNIYVEEQVRMAYLRRISDLLAQASGLDDAMNVSLSVGEMAHPEPLRADGHSSRNKPVEHNLNSEFSFDTFVEGKSNELAKAAA